MDTICDVAVVGGGLAGMVAAIKCAANGKKVVLIDYPVRAQDSTWGGFAPFSGAKFSLPPAGMGLSPIAGGRDKLQKVIDEIIGLLGLNQFVRSPRQRTVSEDQLLRPNGLKLRKYESIVLTPSEIAELICGLKNRIPKDVVVKRDVCERLRRLGSIFEIRTTQSGTIRSDCAIVAAGRSMRDIILPEELKCTSGKGIDFGVRIEFANKEALKNLRDLGPDAKIIDGECRTFCLNYPGKVFRYSYRNTLIPGGIVANQDHQSSNFGILLRSPRKEEKLTSILKAIEVLGLSGKELAITEGQSGLSSSEEMLTSIFGRETFESLRSFCQKIGESDFVDWSQTHVVHIPLLDWHWPTYAVENSLRTNLQNLWVVGDISGHARGLLQAAVSGWLAADDYLNECL